MQCYIEETLASMKLLFSRCWWNVIFCFVMKKIFLFLTKSEWVFPLKEWGIIMLLQRKWKPLLA